MHRIHWIRKYSVLCASWTCCHCDCKLLTLIKHNLGSSATQKLSMGLVMNSWEKKTKHHVGLLQSCQRVWQQAGLWKLVRESFSAAVIAHLRSSAKAFKCHRLGKILQEQKAGEKIGPGGNEKAPLFHSFVGSHMKIFTSWQIAVLV